MIVKLAVLAVTGAIAAVSFRKENESVSTLLIIGVGVVLLGYAVAAVMGVLEQISEAFVYTGMDSAYLKIFFKSLGISVLTSFAGECCEDAGYRTLSSQIILAGKVTIISLSMPILMAVLRRCIEMIEA